MKSLVKKIDETLAAVETALETRADKEGDKAEREVSALEELQSALESARDEFENARGKSDPSHCRARKLRVSGSDQHFTPVQGFWAQGLKNA